MLRSTVVHRYADCPAMGPDDDYQGDHLSDEEVGQVTCRECRDYLGLDPLPDVADRLYGAYLHLTDGWTSISIDDENAIKDAYNEILRLREIVRHFHGEDL